MMTKLFGSAVYGVEAITITIEVDFTKGISYSIVGLPDNAVKESLQRVESAIKNNGFTMPRERVVINMAPADIRNKKKSERLSTSTIISRYYTRYKY